MIQAQVIQQTNISAVGLKVVFLSRFTRWNRFEGCCAFDTVRAYPVIPYYQATKKQTPKQQHDVKHVNLTSTSNASYGTCGETERASDV